ncbi:hypothetical protein [Sediminibacterium sp.]|uniref:hypothetical protein n=1 Tax=Sediminibacterium sp. TaxID=1917865 RepID=UPI002731EB2E|nr:hypothetical protein [Sediminibacterium sp.]MDP1971415.1 hypothetical protein [Sediminibacterium sp.]MDP2420101.1 hypothetical protein [Sediminibacterium sp.]
MKYTYLIIIVIFFSYCNNEKSTPPVNQDNTSLELNKDSLYKIKFEELKQKYSALEIDDDSLNFTYELDDFIKTLKSPIIISGRVIDILKHNEDYKIIVKYSYGGNFEIMTVINIDKYNFLKFKFDLKERYDKGYFIINPISIKPLYPILKAENGSDEDDADLTYDFNDNVVKLEGQLIDYYIEY